MIAIPTINSFIRVLHASPGTPAVDIYANGELIISNIAYKKISKYLAVGPGSYNIKVFPSGEDNNPIIDTDVNIPESERITIAAIGTLPHVSLLPLIERFNEKWDPHDAIIRFAHLSPNAPPVDITLPDGTKLFSNVGYTQVTDYIVVSPDTYNLEVRPADKDVVLLTAANIVFKAGKAYTVYAVGLIDETPPLEVIYYEDKIPFLGSKSEKANANIRIVFKYF